MFYDDSVTLNPFHKIRFTWTRSRVSFNSSCQSLITILVNLCIVAFFLLLGLFLMFLRLVLNRLNSFWYLHKASGIWNGDGKLYCCEKTKLKKVCVLDAFTSFGENSYLSSMTILVYAFLTKVEIKTFIWIFFHLQIYIQNQAKELRSSFSQK